MNPIQEAILVGSREQSGVWDILSDISGTLNVDTNTAFRLLKSEYDFIKSRNDIFFIFSEKLYESDGSKVLDKSELLNVDLNDVLFVEGGAFYYFSNVPGI